MAELLSDVVSQCINDLVTFTQIRGSRFIKKELTQGRNIFICSPGKAVNLSEKVNGTGYLSEKSINITLFNCDTFLVGTLFKKIESVFEYIAH